MEIDKAKCYFVIVHNILFDISQQMPVVGSPAKRVLLIYREIFGMFRKNGYLCNEEAFCDHKFII